MRRSAFAGAAWHGLARSQLGSYVRNQFQYTAHLTLGLKINDTILVTPEDFRRQHCIISSPLHTKNRFAYTCTIPSFHLTLTARYFLIQENALGCIVSLVTASEQPLSLTCYLIHTHTHNPFTSRLWEHGFYALQHTGEGCALLGLASEGDVFIHGVRAADGCQLQLGLWVTQLLLRMYQPGARQRCATTTYNSEPTRYRFSVAYNRHSL